MRRRTGKQAARPRAMNEAAIVAALEAVGARFVWTSAGSLIVRFLSLAPAELQEKFFDCDSRAFVAAVRNRAGAAQHI